MNAPLQRILFVSHKYASDYQVKVGGLFRRMRLLLEAASLAARHVDVLLFAEPDLIERHGPVPSQRSLRAAWGIDSSVVLAPRKKPASGRVARTLLALTDMRHQDDYRSIGGQNVIAAIKASVKPDTGLVVAHRLPIGASVVRARLATPVLMDLDDIEHRKLERQAMNAPAGWRNVLRHAERVALRRGELATLARCTTSLVCSRDDLDYLERLGIHNVTVVPNAVAAPPRASASPTGDTLFFIGSFGYEPNVEAALILVREILPRVRRIRTSTRLVIAGEAVERVSARTGSVEGVDFRGFEPDLERLYDEAGVVCCPIRVGGGTRIKLIEAAMRAKPMVSTTIGAEGLGFVDGKEIVLADTADDLATACIRMLDEPAFSRALGIAAQRKAIANYERSQVAGRLAAVMCETAAAERPT